MSEPPIACTLSAAEFRVRRASLFYLEVTGPPGTRELLDQLQS